MIRLKNILIAQPKSRIKAGDGLEQGKFKFFTSSQVQSKWLNQFHYLEPALIFGTGGAPSIHYCDTPFSTSTDCIVFYGRSETELQTIYWYLSTNDHILKDGFRGSGLKHISKEYLLNIMMPELDQKRQEKLVRANNEVQQLIEIYQKQIERLDLLVKSRFVEMFGDVILNEKSWPKYLFSDIASSRLGKMLDAKQQTGQHSFPYLANFNVQWFRFDLSKMNQMDFNEKDQKEFALNNGDLLVCEGGEIGRCAIWRNEIRQCYFQKALHRVRCNTELVLPEYLAWWFKYNCDNGGFSEIEGAKATISHLPGVKLKALQVAIPPLALQTRFSSFLEQTDKSKFAIQKSLAELETLKKALMQQYFG